MNRNDQLLRTTIERYFGAGGEEIDSILQGLKIAQLDGSDWLFRTATSATRSTS